MSVLHLQSIACTDLSTLADANSTPKSTRPVLPNSSPQLQSSDSDQTDILQTISTTLQELVGYMKKQEVSMKNISKQLSQRSLLDSKSSSSSSVSEKPKKVDNMIRVSCSLCSFPFSYILLVF